MRPGTFGGERPGKCTEGQREGPDLGDWRLELQLETQEPQAQSTCLKGKGRNVAQGGKLPVLVDANLRNTVGWETRESPRLILFNYSLLYTSPITLSLRSTVLTLDAWTTFTYFTQTAAESSRKQ